MARIGRVATGFALAWVAACGEDATMGLDAGTDADPGGGSFRPGSRGFNL